jgi:hypothetical protein
MIATFALAVGIAMSVPTIDLTELDADSFPECSVEDCSDQADGSGMWLDEDTGDWYLILPNATYLVVDDTVTPHGQG